jgi:hypothetical protein
VLAAYLYLLLPLNILSSLGVVAAVATAPLGALEPEQVVIKRLLVMPFLLAVQLL